MKTFLNLCCAASVTCVLSFVASDLGVPISIAGKKEEPVEGTPTVAFSSHVRVKVVQYFDTYRTDPLGLPPACAAGIRAKEMPAAWTHPGISSVRVIPEGDRYCLVDAPPELVRVLPVCAQEDVRYYLAGDSLVAVDSRYKVLDSVRIPSVRLSGEVESAGNARPFLLVSQRNR